MPGSFTDEERAALLAVKGVGPTVIARLEEIGITDFGRLARSSATEICASAAAMLGSSCWKNSPQARSAIEAAIARAGQGL